MGVQCQDLRNDPLSYKTCDTSCGRLLCRWLHSKPNFQPSQRNRSIAIRKRKGDRCHSMGGPSGWHPSTRARIKGKLRVTTPLCSPLPAHLHHHEVESRCLPPAPIRRGHPAALQTIRRSPCVGSIIYRTLKFNDHRNLEQTGSPGDHVQTQKTLKSNAAISKFLSIGRRTPPEKRGSQSPSMVPPSHPGRGHSSPTQVLPLLSFSMG